jgi:undecaprenyl-diphosphatase
MPVEQQLLLAIHAHATPWLDLAFRLSHELGTFPFCTALVLGTALVHWTKGDPDEAKLWLLVGVSTALLQSGLKLAIARPRPFLWPRLIGEGSFSFPSGHALSSATFFPLLARDLTALRPAAKRIAWALGTLLPLYIGFGRLYLGLHWPSDVLAGWALGAAQTAFAIQIRERARR